MPEKSVPNVGELNFIQKGRSMVIETVGVKAIDALATIWIAVAAAAVNPFSSAMITALWNISSTKICNLGLSRITATAKEPTNILCFGNAWEVGTHAESIGYS